MEKENKRNNLFDYATSELSQDAFICWLIEWINHEKEDINLYKTAKSLLNKLFNLFNISIPLEYRNIIVKKQFEKIDVLIIINNEYVIIIEDKTNTRNHSDQLNRYKNAILKSKSKDLPSELSEDKLLLIYFKTGNQSNFSDVKDKEYMPFLRNDFLDILDNYSTKISNAIFKDYHDYLQNIEAETNSYKKANVNKWEGYAWQGFLMELYDSLNSKRLPYNKTWDNWRFVNNARGGFWSLAWAWSGLIGEPKIEVFILLELEEGEKTKKRLCFKVYVQDKEKRKDIRDKLFEIAKQNNDYKKEENRPNFSTGEHMTFWIHKQNIFEDYNKTHDLKNIKQIMEVAEKQLGKIKNQYTLENKLEHGSSQLKK